MMKKAFERYPSVLAAAILLIGFIISLTREKGDFFLRVNEAHTPFLDQFFKLATYLGEGWLFAIILVILLFIRYSWFLILAIAAVIQILVVNIFQRGLAADWPRPVQFYKDTGIDLNLVDGVDVHYWHAFPSGHTATAFTIAMFFIFITKRAWLEIVLLALAVLVGLSRIYFAQHFLVDVVGGAFVGVMSMYIAEWIAEHFNLDRIKGSLGTMVT